MAELRQIKARSCPTLATGKVVCNPETGRLTPIVAPTLTENIAIEIGPYRLWMSRAEFLEHADNVAAIARMIRTGAKEGT